MDIASATVPTITEASGISLGLLCVIATVLLAILGACAKLIWMLSRMDEKLDTQSELVCAHSEMLQSHSMRLTKIETKLDGT